MLPDFIISNAVENALREDLGHAGDITTNSVIPANSVAKGEFRARESGVIAGNQFAQLTFKALSDDVIYETILEDGKQVNPGDTIATVSGPSRALLTGERVALNYMGHLSGIASLTNKFVSKVSQTKSKICCTRKTTPGLRAFEKYAVKAGGGVNHRFGLDDAVMIKDNHIAVVGDIKTAVAHVRQHVGHSVKIEVEVDTLDQLEQLLQCDADIVLLDNMSIETLLQAVKMVENQMITEASGGVTLTNVLEIAQTNVDLISIGALTHSSTVLDVGLDFGPVNN